MMGSYLKCIIPFQAQQALIFVLSLLYKGVDVQGVKWYTKVCALLNAQKV